MKGDAVRRVRSALAARSARIGQDKGHDFMAQCPAHADGRPSLHVAQGASGAVLHCFAGCEVSCIVDALGLTQRDLFDDRTGAPSAFSRAITNPNRATPPRPAMATPLRYEKEYPRSPLAPPDTSDRLGGMSPDDPALSGIQLPESAVRAYEWRDESGAAVAYKVRCAAGSKYQWKKAPGFEGKPGELPLYRWAEVRERIARGEDVYLVDGEKDADNLRAAGLNATCAPGNMSLWRPQHTQALADALDRATMCPRIVVIPDRGETGHSAVLDSLAQSSARHALYLLPLPAELNGYGTKDVTDFLAAGGTAETLRSMTATRVRRWGKTVGEPSSESGAGAGPVMLVPHFAYLDRVFLLPAPPGAGKSTLAAQAGAALVTGGEFLGERIPRAGALLSFSADEPEDDTLGRLRDMGVSAGAPHLVVHDSLTIEEMRDCLDDFMAEWSGLPVLVLIDSWRRLCTKMGSRENDPDDTSALYGELRGALVRRDTAVVILAHTAAGGTAARGSSVQESDADAVIEFMSPQRLRALNGVRGKGAMPTVEANRGERSYRLTKQRRGIPNFSATLDWLPAPGSFVVRTESAGDPAQPPGAGAKRGDDVRVLVLEAAREAGAIGIVRGNVKKNKAATLDALKALQASGLLSQTMEGRTPRYRITDAGLAWLTSGGSVTDSPDLLAPMAVKEEVATGGQPAPRPTGAPGPTSTVPASTVPGATPYRGDGTVGTVESVNTGEGMEPVPDGSEGSVDYKENRRNRGNREHSEHDPPALSLHVNEDQPTVDGGRTWLDEWNDDNGDARGSGDPIQAAA